MTKPRTPERFTRMKVRAWSRRNRTTLAIRRTTRAFRRVGIAAEVTADAFGNFFIALNGVGAAAQSKVATDGQQ